MGIDRTDLSDWAVLRPQGRLDLELGRELTDAVQKLCEDGTPQVVLDLTDVRTADASGLGALVVCLRTTRAHGGDFRLAAVHRDLRRGALMRQIERIFRVHETVHEAIAAGEHAPRGLRRPRRRGLLRRPWQL